MRDTTRKLLILIDQYINREINYTKLYSDFNELLSKSEEIDDEEAHLEWDINDRLAYVADDPIDQESRKDGYIGAAELISWLKDYKQKNISFWDTSK